MKSKSSPALPILSHPALSYPSIQFLHGLSCSVLSCPVLSCPVQPCQFNWICIYIVQLHSLSCPTLPCTVLTCPLSLILAHPKLCYTVLSHPSLSCSALSCPPYYFFLSCPVCIVLYLSSLFLSCPILHRPVLSLFFLVLSSPILPCDVLCQTAKSFSWSVPSCLAQFCPVLSWQCKKKICPGKTVGIGLPYMRNRDSSGNVLYQSEENSTFYTKMMSNLEWLQTNCFLSSFSFFSLLASVSFARDHVDVTVDGAQVYFSRWRIKQENTLFIF